MRESAPRAQPALPQVLLLQKGALLRTRAASATARNASYHSLVPVAATCSYLPVPLALPGRFHLSVLLLCTPAQQPPTLCHLRRLTTFGRHAAQQTQANHSSRRWRPAKSTRVQVHPVPCPAR